MDYPEVKKGCDHAVLIVGYTPEFYIVSIVIQTKTMCTEDMGNGRFSLNPTWFLIVYVVVKTAYHKLYLNLFNLIFSNFKTSTLDLSCLLAWPWAGINYICLSNEFQNRKFRYAIVMVKLGGKTATSESKEGSTPAALRRIWR